MLSFILSLLLSQPMCENGLSCCPNGDPNKDYCYSIADESECRPGSSLAWCIDDNCGILEPFDANSGRRCCPVYDNEVLPDACTVPLGQTLVMGLTAYACEAGSIAARCQAWIEKAPGIYACVGVP